MQTKPLPGAQAGGANPTNREGILLFEASPTDYFNRYTNVLQSAPPRTNFMTNGESGSDAHFDEYSQTPSVVLLGDDKDDQVPPYQRRGRFAATPDHDFGPTPPPFQSKYIFLGTVVGVGVGVGLYFSRLSDEIEALVALPGDLFVRALQCLIVPLVFCVISIVVAETMLKGQASILRWRTIVPYATTSVLASIQGIALAVAFHASFNVLTTSSSSAGLEAMALVPTVSTSFNLSLACSNSVAVDNQAELTCAKQNATTNSSMLRATVVGSTVTKLDTLTLVDQVVGIVRHVVSDSIFTSFGQSDLLSITIFALPFGVAIALCHDDPAKPNVLLNLCRQVRNIFLLLLHGLLGVTPVAIVFLVGRAVAQFHSDQFAHVVVQVTTYVVVFTVGQLGHMLVVLPLYLYIRTRENPFGFMKHLVPAYIFAFGCASSMATLPVTIACIQRANVSRALIHIAMPFGTPMNLNASGIDYPLALVFIANMSGFGDQLTAANFVLLFFVTILGCVSTAPVPNAGLVYHVTVWQTLFPTHPMPAAFAWIVAMNVIVDRIATVVNVNGNAVVTRILAEEIDEAFDARAAAATGGHPSQWRTWT
ncbi:hypothetical protein DYB25_006557 [Aphanomyces astaci]|uniref:Amino acid transporter n=1 Tax=Aphanomyces astaci TaxID=112090 RepID=A0A397BLW3_APHAT|nr:hypothetical protein DYB25_006557 [Aphanomyces astaci]